MSATKAAGTGSQAAHPEMVGLGPTELRRRRRALGLTQAELADWLMVTANTVARWERGELGVRNPRAVARVLQQLERKNRLLGHPSSEPRNRRRRDTRSEVSLSRTLTERRGNLPADVSSFVGRGTELARVAERLEDARLLTLTGSGGVGKTRLALQVATRGFDRYADGAWLVELAALADQQMLPHAVAAALGIREHVRTPLVQTLAAALRYKQLLIVLDNCEHVLDGCARLAQDLVKSCPQVTILATSREPLRVSTEVRWPVHPLPVSVVSALAGAPQPSDAVQLFVERARAVVPDFGLTAQNHGVIAEVCARLDGLPLAIELAAARLDSVPLPTMLRQLRSATGSLPLLTGGPRDAPARHQTLRATIAWSYELLDADERGLFRRMAPFHGCTLDAVTAICVQASSGSRSTTVDLPPLKLDTLAGLTSLVDKNLLHVQDDRHGQAWYVMLDTVREFALERLEASPEAPAVWRRLTWYYLGLVEQTEAGLRTLGEDVFINHLEREHGNFRAALDWSQAHGYAEASLRLAVALLWFWGVRGHFAEGRARLESLLARFPLREPSGRRASVHARALDAAGRLAAFQGDFSAATYLEKQSLDLAESLDDVEGGCDALDGLAFVAREQGDYQLARLYLERALAKARALAASQAMAKPATIARIATTLTALGALAHEGGDDPSATTLLDESTSLWAQVGDPTPIAQNEIQRGVIAFDAGDYDRARYFAERGMARLEPSHDRRGLAIALTHAGHAAVAQRDFAAAYRHLCRALRINQEIGELAGIAFVLVRFAFLASAEGQPARALRLAGAAAALREQAGTPLTVAYHRRLDVELEPARRALGRLAGASLAEGRTLSLEGAIAEAVATAPPEPTQRRQPDGGPLSAREREVAALISRGYSNHRIATHLVVSESTVATHVQHILGKLDLGSRAQVAVWGVQNGLLDNNQLPAPRQPAI